MTLYYTHIRKNFSKKNILLPYKYGSHFDNHDTKQHIYYHTNIVLILRTLNQNNFFNHTNMVFYFENHDFFYSFYIIEYQYMSPSSNIRLALTYCKLL